MSASTTASPRAPRIDWVDYSKGICIFFVVMLHCNGLVDDYRNGSGWLDYVVSFARPFRMPDFFLIAGLFLANVINRPWRAYLDKKVVHFYYFYALWASIEFFAFTLRQDLAGGADAARLVRHYIRLFLDPEGSLWFIHILPIFFVVTRLTKSLPWWLVWGAAAALHSLQIETGWVIPNEFAARYVYFFSGYAFAPQVFRLAGWALDHRPRAFAYLLGWGLLNAYLVGRGWARLPGVSLVLGYLGAMAIVFTAGLFSRLRWAQPLRYLGEHSIVVYLADFLVSAAALAVLAPFISDVGSLALAVTVATVAGTVALYWLCRASPLWFLYRRPRWLSLSDRPPRAPLPATAVLSQGGGGGPAGG